MLPAIVGPAPVRRESWETVTLSSETPCTSGILSAPYFFGITPGQRRKKRVRRLTTVRCTSTLHTEPVPVTVDRVRGLQHQAQICSQSVPTGITTEEGATAWMAIKELCEKLGIARSTLKV